MMRTGHHLAGASAGLAAATVAGWSLPVAAATALVAAMVAPLPDVDQRRWWAPLREFRPLQHRRLTHWWGLAVPLVAPIPFAPAPLAWLLASVATGWLSHLVADWVFGKRGPQSTGWRGPGIPFMPWWAYHGLGVRCGGTVERYVAYPVLALTLLTQLALMIGAK